MKISKQRLTEIIREELLMEKDKEGKMAKYDAKEVYQDAVDGFKMIDEYDDLPEWLEAKITKAADYMNSVKDYLEHHQSGKVKEDFGSSHTQMQPFSSKEAKSILDKSVREYAKILRKAQYQVVKDWMVKAKSGVIDYYDLVRGLKTGDIRRAYPYETEFLFSVLNKDKIIQRFNKYFGGKKSMNQRLVKKHKR